MGSSERDRILLAQIQGTALRHAQSGTRSGQGRTAAVAELAELAAGRADLLAECAGIAIGFNEGGLDEVRYIAAAQLCLEGGADENSIPYWIAEGET